MDPVTTNPIAPPAGTEPVTADPAANAGPAAPQVPTTVKISVTDGIKHVQLILTDLDAIGEVAATLAGHPEIGALISNVDALAQAALQGYEDAETVEITPQNIATFQITLALVPPDQQ